MTQTYAQQVVDWLRRHLRPENEPAGDLQLNQMLRVLAIWRSRSIAAAYVRKHGARILQGPFAGMEYVGEATEGALAPRLFGAYESELHPALARFAAQSPEVVIDVGCAEGYYAVGLARLMPQAVVHAFDIDPKARAACAVLAQKNGVADRVVVGERFDPDGFEAFADRRCLVMMDVEGAEDDLLRPDLSPSLARMNLIVETHDVYRPGVLGRLLERFAATHDIERLDQQPKTLPLPDWMRSQSHLDQLLAVWEFRVRPTPWLVMTPKA
jgi:SAM-dependent methyltransferase